MRNDRRCRVPATLASLLVAFATAAQMSGQSAASTNNCSALRVGTVNFQSTVFQTGEAKQAMSDLQAKYEPKKQQLKAALDEINLNESQLNSQSASLSEEDRASRRASIDKKKAKLQEDSDAASRPSRQICKGCMALSRRESTMH